MLVSAGNLFIAPQIQAQPRSNNAQAAPTDAPAAPQTEEQRTLSALQEAAAGQNETSPFSNELTEEEERIVEDLKQIDQEVRAHEQAHKTVGGQYAGAIQYETVTGPDGREYAVAGEVQIDASPVPNNPEATIRKMDVVIRAALAPAQPSPQDFAVARAAQQARAQAQGELLELREAERNGESGNESAQDQLTRLLEEIQNTENLTQNTRGNVFDVAA